LEELPSPLSLTKNVIAKFYRPQRWSREAILEEHEFLLSLQGEGIHAVAPLIQSHDTTLSEIDGLYTAFFPKVLGRMPQEFLNGELQKIGRLMARVHNVGARKPAPHRPTMDKNYFGGWDTLDMLQDWIGPEVRQRYNQAAEEILHAIDDLFDPREFIRIHGDCHKGNLLSNGQEFFLVDFDDFLNGPVIQDFWMLLSGDEEESEDEKNQIIEGYEELREFPDHQWDWIPLLRGLRIISYAGWIARRWEDPSFPRLFPEYNTYTYWAEEVEALEKIAWKVQKL
jgi:Ser/Thr protein kinase RdoA (MazF antagonist)